MFKWWDKNKPIFYQYLRRDMPFAEVLKPCAVYFLFIFYNLSWLLASIFWKFYKLTTKFFLYQILNTFYCCYYLFVILSSQTDFYPLLY
jgi:hypothetical protein